MTDKITHVSDAVPSQDMLGVISTETLAFDALAMLVKQFTSHSDIHRLIQVFLWTLSGEFSVPNAFLLLNGNNKSHKERIFSGVGTMKSNKDLESLQVDTSDEEFFLNNRSPLVLKSKPDLATIYPIFRKMVKNNVRIVAPLIYEDNFIGLVGFGEKVTKKEMTAREFELLEVLFNTTIPFIANCIYIQNLSRLNFWYSSVLDSIRHALFIFDSNFILQRVNSSGLKLMEDCGVAQWITRIDMGRSVVSVFPHEIFPNVASRIVLSENESTILLPHVIARINDTTRVFDLNISSTESIFGFGSDVVVTLEDVTEKENIEQKLIGLEKYAEKGKMAASIAHELNNFLALLLGGVELLNRNVRKGDLTRMSDRLVSLRDVIGKMKRFTDDLMDYTIMETKKSVLSLNKLIYDVLSFMTVQNKFNNILIEAELDASIPLITLDGDQVSQVLINFLNNSAEAIQEASRMTGKIVVRTRHQGSIVIFEVEDNGAGMTSDVNRKLFKIQQSTKQHGHGFGMVTCGKIIKSHGGSVSVSSAEDMGTTITVSLPIDS